ncbi:MAG: GntR family transcriptional regulator [Acidobacteriota bacterium]
MASILREEIIRGRVVPGERIVEGKWATKLKVAQASIREALNILGAEGFVQKGPNRSATVTRLTTEDVLQTYQVRAALESLAARLVAERKPDLGLLDQALADMRSAAECNNMRAFYERDLQFHLLICELSGNRVLLDHVRRLVVPLFAFVVMKRGGAMDEPERWKQSVVEHGQIVACLREGDPDFAEAFLAKAVRKFAGDTHDVLIRREFGKRFAT